MQLLACTNCVTCMVYIATYIYTMCITKYNLNFPIICMYKGLYNTYAHALKIVILECVTILIDKTHQLNKFTKYNNYSLIIYICAYMEYSPLHSTFVYISNQVNTN